MHLKGVFRATHRPVVSLSSLPPPLSPQELQLKLAVGWTPHASTCPLSLPPLESLAAPLPFASGLHAALAPSPGSSRQRGPAQPHLLGCRASGTRPWSIGGLADRRQGKPPILHVKPPSPPPWPRGLPDRCPCTQHGCAHAQATAARTHEPGLQSRAPPGSRPASRERAAPCFRPSAACLPPPGCEVRPRATAKMPDSVRHVPSRPPFLSRGYLSFCSAKSSSGLLSLVLVRPEAREPPSLRPCRSPPSSASGRVSLGPTLQPPGASGEPARKALTSHAWTRCSSPRPAPHPGQRGGGESAVRPPPPCPATPRTLQPLTAPVLPQE